MSIIKRLMDKILGEMDVEFYAKLEQEGKARAKRNVERIEQIKQEMGEKYIMHPVHTKGKLDEPRPV